MEFHSQCGEDRWIIENLKPDIGCFCEVGAYDGILSSNTKVFEDLGWSGIAIEADPYLAAQCWENRRCETWCGAVGSVGHAYLKINKTDRGLSGLVVSGVPMLSVVKRLEWFLTRSGLTKLDLLSIDTEGTELDVWRTRGAFDPRILIIEYQTQDWPSQKGEILEAVQSDGYKCVHTTQYNLIFVRC
jgi:hypothetical protein